MYTQSRSHMHSKGQKKRGRESATSPCCHVIHVDKLYYIFIVLFYCHSLIHVDVRHGRAGLRRQSWAEKTATFILLKCSSSGHKILQSNHTKHLQYTLTKSSNIVRRGSKGSNHRTPVEHPHQVFTCPVMQFEEVRNDRTTPNSSRTPSQSVCISSSIVRKSWRDRNTPNTLQNTLTKCLLVLQMT